MKQLQPIPMAHYNNQKPFFEFKDLLHCSHVLLRREDTCLLDQPYEGPYKVEKRWSDLDYLINRDGEKINVNTEIFKPPFISNDLTISDLLYASKVVVKPTLKNALQRLQCTSKHILLNQ